MTFVSCLTAVIAAGPRGPTQWASLLRNAGSCFLKAPQRIFSLFLRENLARSMFCTAPSGAAADCVCGPEEQRPPLSAVPPTLQPLPSPTST